MKVVNTLTGEEAQWKPIIKSQSFVFRIVRHVYNLHENTQSNKIILIKIEMLNSKILIRLDNLFYLDQRGIWKF